MEYRTIGAEFAPSCQTWLTLSTCGLGYRPIVNTAVGVLAGSQVVDSWCYVVFDSFVGGGVECD